MSRILNMSGQQAIQALAASGYSHRWISRELGVNRRPFTSLRTGLRSSLRAEIDATILALKASLDGEPFTPFRLQ
jgi:hypothetical protein